ncbi:hypothetical protein Lal_00036051 [Lupinus albus]|nr:hypothetical protein Lal_00036051 [Lupinus albus]
MDQKSQLEADRIYEDFTPYYEWARDEGSITVLLPGYRIDQLKVQVTSKPALKLMGERQIIENRWSRLNIEFPLPSDYDTDNVTAKFEGAKLYIKFSKLNIKPIETTNLLPHEAPKPKGPSQEVDQKNANNEVSDQKTPQKEKETSYEKEKSKTETEAASIYKMAQKKVSTNNNGLTETTEAATKVAKPVSRSKTRLLDFKTEAGSIDKMAQKKLSTNNINGLTETTEAATKVAKPVSRSKTRLLDFTLSLGPSNQADIDNEDLGDLDSRINKRKKLVLLILLVVGLGLYARNAFRQSSIGSKFQEL